MADHPELPEGLASIADREAVLLAPYAMHSIDSLGREHAEPAHPYRGPYQRDRDRILHSAAYRRLSGKMQVFTGEMGDYHRTRLTHTHEVASIARTMGRALRLNEDLIEALALFHDIGHPPFGHAGEDALDGCLQEDGGFSHNRYALTIAQQLETRYHHFPGLNLSEEVLQGQSYRISKQCEELRPLLEVQLVDVADSIAYDAHDTDDAVKLKLVTLEELERNQLIRQCAGRVRRARGALDDDMLRKAIVHELIDMQVNDVLHFSASQLRDRQWTSASQARQGEGAIGTSEALAGARSELEAFLYERVYRHPRLVEVRTQAQLRLRQVFDGYLARPELLPEKHRQRADHAGLRRAVAEYIAGMTDRFCVEQFHAHFA